MKAALLGGSLAVLAAGFLHGFEIFVTSLQFSNEHGFFFYLKLPPSFGDGYLESQHHSFITDTTISQHLTTFCYHTWLCVTSRQPNGNGNASTSEAIQRDLFSCVLL